MNDTRIQVLCGTVIIGGVVAAIVAMAWHGTIAGSDAMVAITAIIGIGGGAISHASGVSAGATAAATGTAAAGTTTPTTTTTGG